MCAPQRIRKLHTTELLGSFLHVFPKETCLSQGPWALHGPKCSFAWAPTGLARRTCMQLRMLCQDLVGVVRGGTIPYLGTQDWSAHCFTALEYGLKAPLA